MINFYLFITKVDFVSFCGTIHFFLFISYKIILKMKFKLKSGLDIAASSWGKEADPLVVLMHGGGQTRHAWGKTGEVLGNSGFQVVAIDLRGHGNSDWHPEGDYSIDGYKSDLISILNQLKINLRLITLIYFLMYVSVIFPFLI